jgi:hypothetical protein
MFFGWLFNNSGYIKVRRETKPRSDFGTTFLGAEIFCQDTAPVKVEKQSLLYVNEHSRPSKQPSYGEKNQAKRVLSGFVSLESFIKRERFRVCCIRESAK